MMMRPKVERERVRGDPKNHVSYLTPAIGSHHMKVIAILSMSFESDSMRQIK